MQINVVLNHYNFCILILFFLFFELLLNFHQKINILLPGPGEYLLLFYLMLRTDEYCMYVLLFLKK